MDTSTQIKSKVRDIAAKGLRILNDDSLTSAQKKTAGDKIDGEIQALMTELESAEFIEARRSSMGVTSWGDINPTVGTAARTKAPSVDISDSHVRDMFNAAQGHKSFRADLSTKNVAEDGVAIGDLPNVLIPGVVQRRHEVRLLERFPISAMPGPVVEYIRHAGTAGSAGTVLPGGLKPELKFSPDTITATARKIVGMTVTTDELLQDFDTWAQYIRDELRRSVIDTENAQILSGSGVAPDLAGLLTTPGLLTRDYSADHTADSSINGIDTIERAITDLRVGPSFVDATDIVMHPTTWSKLRRIKDSQGRYLAQDPTAAEAQGLFGTPVFTTTTIAPGSAVVANLAAAATVFVRHGITLTSSNSNNDDFQRNKTSWIAEERIALAVQRPTAVVLVSNL